MNTLDSLKLIKKQIIQILNAGYLPIELMFAQQVEEALEEIDELLLRPRLQLCLAIRNVKYYYRMQITSFVLDGKLSIILRAPLTTVGAVFQTYSVRSIKLPLTSQHDDGSEGRYTKNEIG